MLYVLFILQCIKMVCLIGVIVVIHRLVRSFCLHLACRVRLVFQNSHIVGNSMLWPNQNQIPYQSKWMIPLPTSCTIPSSLRNRDPICQHSLRYIHLKFHMFQQKRQNLNLKVCRCFLVGIRMIWEPRWQVLELRLVLVQLVFQGHCNSRLFEVQF